MNSLKIVLLLSWCKPMQVISIINEFLVESFTYNFFKFWTESKDYSLVK